MSDYTSTEQGTEEHSTVTPVGAMGMAERAALDFERRMKMLAESQAESLAKLAAPVAPAPPQEPVEAPQVVDWDREVARELLMTRGRSPTDWRPTTYVLEAGEVRQLTGPDEGRKEFWVLNSGANPADLAPARQYLENANSPYYYPLAAGAQTPRIATEGPIWATSAKGTTLTLLVTFYDAGKVADAVRKLSTLIGAKIGPPHQSSNVAGPSEREPG